MVVNVNDCSNSETPQRSHVFDKYSKTARVKNGLAWDLHSVCLSTTIPVCFYVTGMHHLGQKSVFFNILHYDKSEIYLSKTDIWINKRKVINFTVNSMNFIQNKFHNHKSSFWLTSKKFMVLFITFVPQPLANTGSLPRVKVLYMNIYIYKYYMCNIKGIICCFLGTFISRR